LGNTLRFLTILAVGLGVAVTYGVLRLGTLFVRDRARRAARIAHLRGRLLRWAMATLGATFIKLGQVMSSRPDLFAPEMIDELRKLQDRLPPFAFRRVRRILEADLGGSLEARFPEFAARPIAAASVAQVHRARLADGTAVAVKVLRPDVRRVVVRDGGVLLWMARVWQWLRPHIRPSEPIEHLRHFVAGILAQTDLLAEADNYDVFRANFASVPGVRFPRVYREHCSARVLTMELISGSKLDDIDPADHAHLGNLVRTTFFKMCFEDGFVHADLHPGNMLVTPERELCIFDVGLVKRMTDQNHLQIIDYARCLALGTARDFVAHFRRFHTFTGEPDWDALERDAQRMVDHFRRQNISELELRELIDEVFAMSRRHNIHPIPEITLILVGVITAEGLAKKLEPHANSFDQMAAYLGPLVQRLGLGGAPAASAAAVDARRS
jgi:ubiquinone biosynthesis protein